MKTWLTRILTITLCAGALLSCEKDEDRLTVKQGTAPALTSSASTIVLNKDDADEDALTFTWTPLDLIWSKTDYTFANAAAYTLEVDKAGNNFAKPVVVAMSGTTSKKYTVTELNTLLTKLELTPGVADTIEARIKSQMGANTALHVSNILKVMATPFVSVIDYPSVYVPGSYQGWTPATADKIASVKDDKTYEGYFNFPDAVNEFKITSDPDWDHTNYGDAGNGKLSTDGGNFKVEGAGYYLLKANLNANTWSATKVSWGVIGDATGSWDADKDMTYDPATKAWKITLNLSAGELKFRANDAWDINLGDKATPDGFLEYGGKNIKITEAGKYDITLNLSYAGNLIYTLKKI